MRNYLAAVKDVMSFDAPMTEPEEDKVLAAWQVLLRVANHGRDHRPQTLRSLNNLSVKTHPQD